VNLRIPVPALNGAFGCNAARIGYSCGMARKSRPRLTQDEQVTGFLRIGDPVGVRLLAIGWARIRPDLWRWRLRKPYWVMYRNGQDGGQLVCNGTTVQLRAGRCYVVPAWLSFVTSCRRPFDHLFVNFAVDGLAGHGTTPVVREVLSFDPGSLATVLDGLVAAPGAKPAVQVQAHLAAMLLSAIAPALGSPADAAADPALAPALRRMNERFAATLPVEELARACRLSTSAFTRRFRSTQATTPVQYLRRLRVQHAMRLLTSTDWDMQRIATSCGFGNRTYFARVFRELMDQPPDYFRRTLCDEGPAYHRPRHRIRPGPGHSANAEVAAEFGV